MKILTLILSLFTVTSCVPLPPVDYNPPGTEAQSLPTPQIPQMPQLGGDQKIPSAPAGIIYPERPTKPRLQRLANGHYRVLADWPVRVSGRNFLVQKGYTSNGITAPKSIKSMLGDHINAPETWTAVFHDWCFTQKGLTRAQCDDYYIQLMRNFRISPRKIQLMGATVKGYSIYKGN